MLENRLAPYWATQRNKEENDRTRGSSAKVIAVLVRQWTRNERNPDNEIMKARADGKERPDDWIIREQKKINSLGQSTSQGWIQDTSPAHKRKEIKPS